METKKTDWLGTLGQKVWRAVNSLGFIFASYITDGVLEEQVTKNANKKRQEELQEKPAVSRHRTRKRGNVARKKAFRQQLP